RISPAAFFLHRCRGRLPGEVDGLGLEVVVEAFGSTLAADARLLETAERLLRIDDHAVDGDVARADAAGNGVAALRIGGVDRGVEAVVRIVGLAHRIVL